MECARQFFYYIGNCVSIKQKKDYMSRRTPAARARRWTIRKRSPRYGEAVFLRFLFIPRKIHDVRRNTKMRQKNMQYIIGFQLQRAGVDAGMKADVFSRQQIAVNAQ